MLAAVIGAGLAGSIASLVLARNGWRVATIEKRARSPRRLPSEHMHAHIFRDEDIAWVRRLLASARMVAGPGDAALDGSWPDSGLEASCLTRRALDRALTSALRACPSILTRYRTRADSLVWDRGAWCVRLDSGEEHRADLLLDASGRALGAAKRIAPSGQNGIVVEEITDSYRYMSWIVARSPTSSCAKPKSVILDGAARVYLFQNGEAQETLTWIGRSVPPRSWLELHSRIAAADADFARSLTGKVVVSGPLFYNSSALARSAIEMLPDGVLLLGDSLIQTPPRYGDGLQHVCAQARLLESHLVAGRAEYGDCKAQLASYAEQVWNGVALTIGLEAGGLG